MEKVDYSWKESLQKITKTVENNHERASEDIIQLRTQFEHHKSKEFVALVERVTALEKKFIKLAT